MERQNVSKSNINTILAALTMQLQQLIQLVANPLPSVRGHLGWCLVGIEGITNGHLLFVMGALILQRAQKCEVRQVTKDVVKSEV